MSAVLSSANPGILSLDSVHPPANADLSTEKRVRKLLTWQH